MQIQASKIREHKKTQFEIIICVYNTMNMCVYVRVQVTRIITLSNVTPLNIFYLDVNFDKSTIKVHYLRIFSILEKFQGDQRLIVMLSFNFLNSNFGV